MLTILVFILGLISTYIDPSDYLYKLELMKKKDCLIIDADKTARLLTEKGSPYLAMLRETFGDDFFFDDGELNRKKLGRYIFARPEKKAVLERKNKNFYLSARRSRPILFFLLLFYFYFFFYIVSWPDLRQIDTQFTTD